MDWAKIAQSTTVGVIGLVLVLTACLESFAHGQIDPALLTLVAAVIATYFTGTAVRQVNGAKVDALTNSVLALHARLDTTGLPPADGSGQTAQTTTSTTQSTTSTTTG
jgi:phosphate/sulfate permease